MTQQKIIYIIKTTATALVAFCLLWLTLLDVHTGWCEELPVLLNAMLAIGVVALVSVIFKKQMCKICWLDKTVLLWFVYITFNYWFIFPYPAGNDTLCFYPHYCCIYFYAIHWQKTINRYYCSLYVLVVLTKLCLA